jgi:hypothetical protein
MAAASRRPIRSIRDAGCSSRMRVQGVRKPGASCPSARAPCVCPGRQLVLLLTSALLARLLRDNAFTLESHRLSPEQPLPGTLNHFALQFRVSSL